MATNKIVLFQLGTLCFVLLVLLPAVHGKKGTGVLALYGTARCKSNPSRTINNATLQVTINGTVVATGETKRAGRFLLVANVTSGNQLVALITRNEATITAPPGVCGGGGIPAATAAGQKLVAAVVHLSGGSDDDDILEITADWLMTNIIDRYVAIINSPPVDYNDLPFEFRGNILVYIDQNSETEGIDSARTFFDSIAQGQPLLDAVSNFLGIPPTN